MNFLKKARELADFFDWSADSEQVATIAKCLSEAREDAIEECAQLIKNIGDQYGLAGKKFQHTHEAFLLASGNVRSLKDRSSLAGRTLNGQKG